MEESKRQRQVARLIQEELSDIFLREQLNMMHGGMVSISKVGMTPDLLEARIYLSLFQVSDTKLVLSEIRESTKEIRKQLGNRVRNQLRRVPELTFFIDDALDHVFKMETLFDQIKKEREERDQNQSCTDES